MDLNKDIKPIDMKKKVKDSKYLQNIKKAIPFVRSVVGINNKEVQMQNAQVFLLSEILERLDRIANHVAPMEESKNGEAVESKTIKEIDEKDIKETQAEKIAKLKNKAK